VSWGDGYGAGQAGMLKAIETAEQLGKIRERERIIALIERQICFDAQADEDGRCSHHGGKCYELRQLIKNLESE
jgi:hypothetical protein